MLVSGSTPRPTTLDQLISAELCARLDRIDLVSRKVFAGKMQGERRSKRRGQSVEFEDYRNYVPGDDLRHVDWNIYARLEKFFIKIFQEEEDLSVHIVVDATASMDAGTPSKLTLAMRLAMSLAYIAIVNNDRLSMSLFNGSGLHGLGPVRGRRYVQRVGAFLLEHTQMPGASGVSGSAAAVDDSGSGGGRGPGGGRGDFNGALRTIASTRAGKGVMIVISDFLIPGGYQDGLRLLSGGGSGGVSGGGSGGGSGAGGGGYDTHCVQILAPAELDPSLETTDITGGGSDATKGRRRPSLPSGREFVGDMRLIDVETGRATEVTITAEVIKKYKQAVLGYVEELRAFCAARDMSFGMVTSDTQTETLLLNYLRMRGLLR